MNRRPLWESKLAKQTLNERELEITVVKINDSQDLDFSFHLVITKISNSGLITY